MQMTTNEQYREPSFYLFFYFETSEATGTNLLWYWYYRSHISPLNDDRKNRQVDNFNFYFPLVLSAFLLCHNTVYNYRTVTSGLAD